MLSDHAIWSTAGIRYAPAAYGLTGPQPVTLAGRRAVEAAVRADVQREVRTVEWGVHFPSAVVWTAADEHEAHYEAENFGVVVMRREVCPWLPVTPSTPNQQGDN